MGRKQKRDMTEGPLSGPDNNFERQQEVDISKVRVDTTLAVNNVIAMLTGKIRSPQAILVEKCGMTML